MNILGKHQNLFVVIGYRGSNDEGYPMAVEDSQELAEVELKALAILRPDMVLKVFPATVWLDRECQK